MLFNRGPGIQAEISIEASQVEVKDNGGAGIVCGAGGAILTGVEIVRNGGAGVECQGPIQMMAGRSRSDVSGNKGGSGVSSPGLVNVSGIYADSNHGAGISGGLVIGDGVRADGNSEEGVRGMLFVSVDSMSASGNGKEGVASRGPIMGSDILLMNNQSHGVKAGGPVGLTGGRILGNQGYGIVYGRALSLEGVSLQGNTLGATAMSAVGGAGTLSLAAPEPSSVTESMIIQNLGDGLTLGAGVPMTISRSNIYGNSGYGVNATASGAAASAAGNWWGHPSGPSGAGPGSGEEITGTVAYSPWLSSAVSLVIVPESDLLYAARGQSSAVTLYLQNWSHPTDTVRLTLEDSAGWLQAPLSLTLTMTGTGATTVISFTVPATVPLGATDSVSVTASSLLYPADSDHQSVMIVAALLADVSVDKTGWPGLPLLGAQITYTLAVVNAGPDAATGVRLTDTLPLSLTFASVTSTQGSCAHSSGLVTCSLGGLAAGHTATVTLVVRTMAVGDVLNQAVVTATEHDPDLPSNTGLAASTVLAPAERLYLPVILR